MRPTDLHCHSARSDGALTPAALAAYAAGQGVSVLALTDHDTVAGYAEAAAAAQALSIDVLPGVELSAAYDGELHILGYGIDPCSPALVDFLARQRAARRERNVDMCDALRRMGLPMPQPEQMGEEFGRTHMARLLVQGGFADTVSEAFHRYLFPGCPGSVPRRRPDRAACIDAIRAAGGWAVLAHPGQIAGVDRAGLAALVDGMAGQGLSGLEVFYPGQDADFRDFLLQQCRARRLVPTLGSDYHGPDRPGNALACTYQPALIPQETWDFVATCLTRHHEGG